MTNPSPSDSQELTELLDELEKRIRLHELGQINYGRGRNATAVLGERDIAVARSAIQQYVARLQAEGLHQVTVFRHERERWEQELARLQSENDLISDKTCAEANCGWYKTTVALREQVAALRKNALTPEEARDMDKVIGGWRLYTCASDEWMRGVQLKLRQMYDYTTPEILAKLRAISASGEPK
jgi:hypothetical protein